MIKGVCFDIGGVLYIGDEVINGAIEVINRLKDRYKIRFLTNTTRKKPKDLYNKLKEMGFNIDENMLFTALSATKDYIKEQNATAYTIVADEVKDYFLDIESPNPSFVVVADAYTNFNYHNLNIGFRKLTNGAKLIAAAKNRYFKDSDGELSMDAGGFVEALEYAANTKATIIGKPNKEFFLLACKSMNLNPNEVLMVGDDIETDIKGAKEAGLKSALVKSGKFREDDLKKDIKPDFILDSIKDLLNIV